MRNKAIKAISSAVLMTALFIITAALPAFAKEAGAAAPGEAALSAAPADEEQVSYTLPSPESVTLSNTSTGVKVIWLRISGAENYAVYRRPATSNTWSKKGVTNKNYFTDTTVSNGKVYYYKVRCVDASGNTLMSPNPAGNDCITALKPPSAGSLTNAEEGIKLNFGHPNGTEYFEIWRKTGERGSYKLLVTHEPITESPFIDTTAVVGETYYYYVRAYIDTAPAATSFPAYFEDGITRLVSPAVSAEMKTTGVKLTWDAVPGAENYAVLRKTETGSWIKKAVLTGTTWTDNEAMSGNTYQYKVRCIGSDGSTYLSANPTSVTEFTFMEAPKITSSSNTADGLKITWGSVGGAESYIVYRKTQTGTSWVKKATVEGTNTFTDTTVKSGSSYYYTVRAVHANGTQSLRYTSVDLHTYIGMPEMVSAVNDPEGITVTWNAPVGAEYFRVYRKYTDNGGWTKKDVIHGTSFTDVNVSSGVAYHYTVRPVADETGETSIGPRDEIGVRTFFLRQPKLKSVDSMQNGVLVDFSTVNGATGYEILRDEGEGFVKVGDAETSPFLDATAVYDTTYRYSVRAVCSGEETWSTYDEAGLEIFYEDFSNFMYVTRLSLSLYNTCSSSSSPACTVIYMTMLKYLETTKEYASGSWIKVEYNEGEYYFWQPAGEEYLTHERSSFEYTGETEITQKIIDLAMEMYTWPIRYRHGESNGIPAADGTYGYDCSGFASYVMKTVMQEYVPTYFVTSTIGVLYTTETIYNKGIDGEFSASTVDMADLRAGDVLFFKLIDEADPEDLTADVTHCGIYLGNNEFIHCTHYDFDADANGLFIMPLAYRYTETLVAVRRYVPDTVVPANRTMYTCARTNVRAEMGYDTEVIDVLNAETEVTVLFTNIDRTTAEPKWAYIAYGENKHGFVLLSSLIDNLANEQHNMYVAATSIKLYSQASTSSDYIEVLIRSEVLYEGQLGSTRFHKVRYNGAERYLYIKDGVDLGSLLTDDLDALLHGVGTMIVTKATNLRSNMDSSTSDSVIGVVSQGDEVTLIAVSASGTWSYVRTDNGVYGFMISANLREKTEND